MLTRRSKNNVQNCTKSRSKSIYRGDQSHTLSMHIRIDNQVSPDKLRITPDLQLQHKYSYKENKIQAFRQSLKISESGNLASQGKRTNRQDLESTSNKKTLKHAILETDRAYKQLKNLSNRKESFKLQKPSAKQKPEVTNFAQEEQVAINYDQMKNILMTMKKLAEENKNLKKQLSILVENKTNNSVSKALIK